MKVTGIIMECNPFHEGHAYLLQQARAQAGADYIIAAMSGDYVQRGEPAVYDKYLRAEKILQAGADLVLELPLYAACGSADYFARGGIALLDRLGVVTDLCFGSESGDTDRLLNSAEQLLKSEKDTDFQKRLQKHLREGLSFPAARFRAMQEASAGSARSLPETPNDLLAVEYCRAILLADSGIRPHAVRRIDVPSATQRRKELLLERGENASSPSPTDSAPLSKPGKSASSPSPADSAPLSKPGESASSLSPTDSAPLSKPGESASSPSPADSTLFSHQVPAFPLGPDDFSAQLLYALRMQEARLDCFADISPDLADRIRNLLGQYQNYSGFCSLVKTRNVTHTRISRALLHVLLQIEKDRLAQLESEGLALYARPLAMRKTAGSLLRAIREKSSIPFLPKLSAAASVLPPPAMEFLEEEIRAEELYTLTLRICAGCCSSPAPRAPQRRIITLSVNNSVKTLNV